MRSNLEKLAVIARPNDPLQPIITRMGRGGERLFGLALIVDEGMVLQGVINNGDVLRLLADGVALDCPASEVMIREPITAPVDATDQEIIHTVRSQLIRRSAGKKDVTRQVPLVD